MPYFSIQTSKTMNPRAVADLTAKASAFAAKLLDKPEAYVMTVLTPGAAMTFAGDTAPAAFVELKSIGLPEAQCNRFAAAISAFIRTELGVEPDRIFIDFADLPPTRFAWNGKTFA